MRRSSVDVGAEICRCFVDVFDPGLPVEAYLTEEPGVTAFVEADVTSGRDSDYDQMVPTSGAATLLG